MKKTYKIYILSGILFMIPDFSHAKVISTENPNQLFRRVKLLKISPTSRVL